MIRRLPRSFLLLSLLLAVPVPAVIPGSAEGQAMPPVGGVGVGGATPGAFLGELTWTEAEERFAIAPIVILPFGAGAKEHGPHLPMNADAVVMEFLCQVAVDSLPVVVAPPILHGWFPAFRDYPGTEVADPAVFQAYVMEVASSLIEKGAKRLVILNTGIERATGLPLAMVAREIRVQTGTPTMLVSWDDLETAQVEEFQEQSWGGHGDELETSIHLFLQPHLVHMDQARPAEPSVSGPPGPGYRPGLFSRDPNDPAYSVSGISGDPTLATPEKGERLLAIMAHEWLTALRAFAEVPRTSGG
ncbi:MAG: creatininase family protein [Gemmatimonadota bacterium]